MPIKTKIGVLFLILMTQVSCYHSVKIPPQNLRAIAKYRISKRTVIYDEKKRRIEVLPSMNPTLHLETTRRCSFGEALADRCDSELDVRLENLEENKGELEVEVSLSKFLSRSTRKVKLHTNEIELAELRFDYSPKDWRPTFAFGLSFGGPGALLGYQLHWIPFDALVFDPTLFAAPHVFWAGGGFRFRPFRYGNALPFLGGGVQFMSFAGTDTDDQAVSDTYFLAGPRLGVDFEFFSRRMLVGLEVDLFYDVLENGIFLYKSESRFKPYVGFHLAYQI